MIVLSLSNFLFSGAMVSMMEEKFFQNISEVIGVPGSTSLSIKLYKHSYTCKLEMITLLFLNLDSGNLP